MLEEILNNAVVGFVAGAFIASGGWWKSRDQFERLEKIEARKFLKTAILGGIVGGVTGATGLAPEVVIAAPMYAGITTFVEYLLKGIFRPFSR